MNKYNEKLEKILKGNSRESGEIPAICREGLKKDLLLLIHGAWADGYVDGYAEGITESFFINDEPF